MKSFEGFKPEAPAAGFPMLPKGLYVARITAVKLDGTEPDQRLIIRVEIQEGEYAGYYSRRFKADKERGGRFEPRYKGDYAIQVPNPGNPRRQHYDWDVRSFNGMIWAIEDSNPGYHWDWNEQGLVGKAVGINVRQGTYNGSAYTTIGRLESLERMKEGLVKVMKDAAPRGSAPAAEVDADTGMAVVDDEDIPF